MNYTINILIKKWAYLTLLQKMYELSSVALMAWSTKHIFFVRTFLVDLEKHNLKHKLQKNLKSTENKKTLQELYDFIFRQIELSIREIGYGDQSINKRMKDYINLFHSMVSEIHFWDNLDKSEKLKKFSIFLSKRNIL